MGAEDICDSLDTTVDSVEEAAERVRDRIDFWDSVQPVTTSQTLPSGGVLSLHQLVVDDDDETFVVTRLEDDVVELTEIEPPEDFGKSYVISYGNFVMNGEAQFAANGQPIWAY